jgi:hypothetical protein
VATKKDELELMRRGEGCLGKAADDEPIFVLRAQDKTAAYCVFMWAALQRLFGSTAHDKIGNAERTAYAMRRWASVTGRSKLAD